MNVDPSYKTNDPRGWCGDPKRGAAMGRHAVHTVPADYAGKLVLQHVRINSGGYDENGTYFGTGDPLFWYASECGGVDAVLRARNCADAKTKVLEIYPKANLEVRGLVEFFDAYVECALWSTHDESDEDGGSPLDDNYDRDDISEETHAAMLKDCSAFLEANVGDVGDAYGQAGHDFWLTRNGHGAGFWDGDWPEDVGERLTKASKMFGDVNLYVSDDGKVCS